MEQDNELYWQEMFAWYEEHEPQSVAGIPANHSPRFEDNLAYHGLTLRELSFNEIIQGDVKQILAARGIRPLNNKDYNNHGGVA